MKLLALGFVALTLSACQHTVVRDCVTPEQVKQLRDAEPPKVSDRLTGQADRDLTIVAGSAVRLRAWGRGLLGVVESCGG